MSINRSVLLLSKPSSQSDYSLQVGVSKVLLSDLTSGRCSSRLLRFWEVRNVKHCGELMCVDLLLLDSKKNAGLLATNQHHKKKICTVFHPVLQRHQIKLSTVVAVILPLIRTVLCIDVSVGVHTPGELKALEKRMESFQL
ncbi:hypothetical protein YC2023_081894 [Brassica napus]